MIHKNWSICATPFRCQNNSFVCFIKTSLNKQDEPYVPTAIVGAETVNSHSVTDFHISVWPYSLVVSKGSITSALSKLCDKILPHDFNWSQLIGISVMLGLRCVGEMWPQPSRHATFSVNMGQRWWWACFFASVNQSWVKAISKMTADVYTVSIEAWATFCALCRAHPHYY